MSMLLDLKRELADSQTTDRRRVRQLLAMTSALQRLKLGAHIKDGFERQGTPPQGRLFSVFAEAMLDKAIRSQEKRNARGDSNMWTGTDWQDDLVRELWQHAQKGDPLDVAIYAAFAWYHGWAVSELDTGNLERLGEYASIGDALIEPVKTWHELKVASSFMQDLLSGLKPYEVRRDDRNFEVGHGLCLREFDGERYTGGVRGSVRFVITSALRGARWGIMPGFVCLGLRPALFVEPTNELGQFLDSLPDVDPEQAASLERFKQVYGTASRGALCGPGGAGCQYDAACSVCSNYTPGN